MAGAVADVSDVSADTRGTACGAAGGCRAASAGAAEATPSVATWSPRRGTLVGFSYGTSEGVGGGARVVTIGAWRQTVASGVRPRGKAATGQPRGRGGVIGGVRGRDAESRGGAKERVTARGMTAGGATDDGRSGRMKAVVAGEGGEMGGRVKV